MEMPQIFENKEFGAVRTFRDKAGEPLFVAKDVALALGYEWNGNARIAHIPAEWRGVTSVVTPSGTQEMVVLIEQGLYFFLGRSDKPKALPFQKWLTGEVLPAIRKTFDIAAGDSLLAAIIVLAVMILPSIISVSETALNAVPREYEEASLALGATELETYFRVSVPAAKSGIAAAVVLGVGRAIGEAMAILMVAGNVANMPSLLSSVKFLTTAIASEMSYAAVGSLQRNALYSIGLILFLFIMCINVILNVFLKRNKEG